MNSLAGIDSEGLTSNWQKRWVTLLNGYNQLKQIPIYSSTLIYSILSIAVFTLLNLKLLNPQTPIYSFLFKWHAFFYPFHAWLLENLTILFHPDLIAQGSLTIYQLGWGYFFLSLVLNYGLLISITGTLNILAQKLFIQTGRFEALLKAILFVVVSLALISLLLGVILSFFIQLNTIKFLIVIGLLLAIWLIKSVQDIFHLETKKVILLFLMVLPLFPLAVMLLLFYALLELPVLRKHAPLAEQTIKVWLEILYAPGQALNQISIRYSSGITFFITALAGLMGIFIFYQYPVYALFNPIFQPLAQGFLLLFHKTELAAIYVMSNFSFQPLANINFATGQYIYLFILFLASFFILAALVDFTAWMVFKFNKNYQTTCKYFMSIHSAYMLFFLIIAMIGFAGGYMVKILFGVNNPTLELTVVKVYAFLITLVFFIVLNVFYLRAISKSYSTDLPRAFLIWLWSLVFLPVSILLILANAFIELLSPLIVRYRVKTLQNDVDNLASIADNTPHEKVNKIIDKFNAHLRNRFNFNTIARRKVNIANALTSVLRHRPKVMITNLLTMADSKDPDLSKDAIKWLAEIFKIPSESHIRLFYYMLEQKLRLPVMSQMNDHLDPESTWYQILRIYHELLKDVTIDDDNKKRLAQLPPLFRQLAHDPLADEFAWIYDILSTLANARNISEITRIEEPITEYLQLSVPQETDIQNIFKTFLRLSNQQGLFERLDDENKIPFASMQFALLVEAQRGLDALKGRDLEKMILRNLTARVQNWAVVQNEQLRGSIEMLVELKTETIPVQEQASVIVVELQNAGTALAQNVRLSLQAQEAVFYRVEGDPVRTIPLMEPKARKTFEFSLTPLKSGSQRLLFKCSYMDIDKQEVTFEYGDVIQFTEIELTDSKKYAVGEVINPFIAGTAVAEPRMFFGRTEEFQRIRENLEGRFQDNIIVLHGQRRTGKSSMLLQMQRHMGIEKYICVFINLEGFISSGLQNFLFRFSTLIIRELEKINIKLHRPLLNDFARDPSVYFSDVFLPSVYQKIGSRKLLLMLDEFEQIEKRVDDGKLDRDIFGFLRDLMQHAKNLSFILAGAHQLKEMRTDYWSVLFNITRYVKIGFLDRESCTQLICEPVVDYVKYDPLAIEKIYRVTAGQPYFIQLLCHELFNKYRRERKNYLTVKDVNMAIHGVLVAGSGHLDYIWNTSDWTEKIILAALADLAMYDSDRVRLNNMGARLKELNFNQDDRKSREALNHLVDIEILSSDAHFDSFSFRIDLVREWLKEAHPIGKAIEEYQMFANKSQ